MRMLGEIFLSVVDLSTIVGVILVFLLILRPFLYKKYVAKWWYVIWFILALRLIVPFNLEARVGLTNRISLVLSSQQEKGKREALVEGQVEEKTEDTEVPNLNIEEELNTKTKEELVNSQENAYGAYGDQGLLDLSSKWLADFSSSMGVRAIWLMGIGLFIGDQLLMYFAFRRSCRRWSKKVTDSLVEGIYKGVCKELHIKKPIALMICKKVDSPLVMGFWQPIIVLPDKVYDEQTLYFIVKHELLHYKRGDLWYKLLLVLARGVHWFNPLVHLMGKCAEEDLEVLCDTIVLDGKSLEDKKSYMESILKIACTLKTRTISLSTQFRGEDQLLKQRFTAIVNEGKRKKGRLTIGIIVIVCLLSGLIGITRQQREQVEEATSKEIPVIEIPKQVVAAVSDETPTTSLDETKVLSLSGYEVKVPSHWELQEVKDHSTTYEFYESGKKVGGARLITEKLSKSEMSNLFKLPIDDVQEVMDKAINKGGYALTLLHIQYMTQEAHSYQQYVFCDLPNPPPYAYALYFDLNQVNQKDVEQILESFKIPDLGVDLAKLPAKNRKALTLEQAMTNATCLVGLKDGSEKVFNHDKLDAFIENQKEGIADQLDVLAYIETENGLVIKDWYTITFDGVVGRCFGYYKTDDGTYTYDNIPIVFSKILKKYYPQENIITYRLVGEGGDEENTMRFFQVHTVDAPAKEESTSSAENKKEEKASYILLKPNS